MTQAEIVSAVMNIVTSHEGVTNTSLSADQVAAEVHTCRQRMIDDLDKVSLFRRPFTGYVQVIDSLAVAKEADGTLYVEIPRVYRTINQEVSLLYIGGKDRKSPYRIVTDDGENSKHDHFLGSRPTAIYSEGVIKFRNLSPKFIRVEGVFEYPDQLAIYGYDDEETEYPFPGGMIDKLIGKTTESYLRTLFRVVPQPNTQSDLTNARPLNK
jgi:hypothetical protein